MFDVAIVLLAKFAVCNVPSIMAALLIFLSV
jgi:hypothetical protein